MERKKRASTVRVSLDMSPEANELLGALALEHSTTKSQILRRAVILYKVMSEATAQGQRIGILDRNEKLIREIVGL